MGFLLKEKTRAKPDELKHFVVTTGVKVDVYPAPEELADDAAPHAETMAVPAAFTSAAVDDPDLARNALAAMAYLSILFLVPLFTPRRDEFVEAHLKQGLTLFAVSVAFSFTAWVSAYVWLGLAALVFHIGLKRYESGGGVG